MVDAKLCILRSPQGWRRYRIVANGLACMRTNKKAAPGIARGSFTGDQGSGPLPYERSYGIGTGT